MADLPPDGDLTLGLVALGSGRRLRGNRSETNAPGAEVLWMSDERFEDAGGLWWFLHDQTELVPLILDSLDDNAGIGDRRPWEEDLDLDLVGDAVPGPETVEEILRSCFWDDRDEGADSDPSVSPAPFSVVPGLSPGVDEPLPMAQIASVMMGQSPGWIGLVAADRPADAPMAIGWFGCSDAFTLGPWGGRWNPTNAMTALLRSWEDRFGAKPVRLGFASMELLVERPPRTEDQALHVAAELWNVASEFHTAENHAVRSVRDIAASILGAPLWRFWWD